MIHDTDLTHLRRCLELAKTALEAGHRPFGAVLVSAAGEVLAEDHNRIGSGDNTQHPEIALARWAAQNLTAEERAKATVYTSGEHCPMCAAAHGLVGLGRIVYASSTEQLTQWMDEWGLPEPRVRRLPIEQIILHTAVDGPVPELSEQVRAFHRQYYAGKR